jgi:hypothetical protein
MKHLGSVMQSIRLAAPLATADGAAASGDDSLVASVFVIECNSLEAASGLMAADPYTSQDIWRCVSLYRVTGESGTWLSAPGQVAAGARLYATLSSRDGPGFPENLCSAALFRANLRLEKSLGDAALALPWQSVMFFGADSLGGAQSIVARALSSSDDIQFHPVWAIPLTAGSWPTQTTR